MTLIARISTLSNDAVVVILEDNEIFCLLQTVTPYGYTHKADKTPKGLGPRSSGRNYVNNTASALDMIVRVGRSCPCSRGGIDKIIFHITLQYHFIFLSGV